jgi:hypothetical protein
MMEGPGSGPLTNGSGSGRPKNLQILRIWILTRNTDMNKQADEYASVTKNNLAVFLLFTETNI